MKIYIDNAYKCHIVNDGTMREIETDFFDNKCDAFIEGYRCIPEGETWVREDGTACSGISPWKDYRELDNAQREYERQLLVEKDKIIAELDSALLDACYNNLMEDL